jgi:hypothetical protein
MFSNKQPHLKQNRNIILFQIITDNSSQCISIPKDATLADLFQKIENTLYVTHSIQPSEDMSFYSMVSKKKTNIYKIFATNIERNKYLTLKNTDWHKVVDFIDNNPDYFVDQSQVPQIHNLYRVFVMDYNDYNKYRENDVITETVLKNIQKLKSCFMTQT